MRRPGTILAFPFGHTDCVGKNRAMQELRVDLSVYVEAQHAIFGRVWTLKRGRTTEDQFVVNLDRSPVLLLRC